MVKSDIYNKEIETIQNTFSNFFDNVSQLCINQFLYYLLETTMADAVFLIYKHTKHSHVEYHQFYDKNDFLIVTEDDYLEYEKILIDSFLLNNKGKSGKYTYSFKNITIKAFYYRIYLNPSLTGYFENHYLVFLNPKLLKPNSLEKEYLSNLMIEYLGKIVSVWFWRINYFNEERKILRNELQEVTTILTEIKIREIRDTILETLVWPISLWEYIQIIDVGWEKLFLPNDITDTSGNIIKYQKWSSEVRRKICLGEFKNCIKCKGNSDARTTEEKSLYNEIIPLIPFIKERECGYYNNVLVEKAFQRLLYVKGILWEKIDLSNMNDQSLLLYFTFVFLNDYITKLVNNNVWEEKILSGSEIVKILHSCVNIVLYLLKKNPNDREFISSIRWAVSIFGHEILGVDPRFDISSHLLFAARGETALHSLKPFYRDHFFHALEVCFLGQLLLETWISDTEGFLWEVVKKNAHLKSKDEVQKIWFITSLFHDIGYSMEILNSTKNALNFFQYSGPIKEFVSNINLALQNMAQSLDGLYGFKNNDNPGKDHGAIAAEHLSSLRNKIKLSNDDYDKYELAFEAIAHHNCRKFSVVFEENPFAFLLILCDTIQEWNRPHLNYFIAPDLLLSKLISKSSENSVSGFTGPLDEVKMNIKKDTTTFKMDDRMLLKFQLHYTEEINVNSSVFNLWLDTTCNLQRLKMAGLPFNIKIQFITPKYKGQHFQMHRLREAASDTHMNFLHNWFPNERCDYGSTNYIISHYMCVRELDSKIDNPDGKEGLSINLEELTKKKLITDSIDAVRNKLIKWKKYNEDRDFQGDYGLDNI